MSTFENLIRGIDWKGRESWCGMRITTTDYAAPTVDDLKEEGPSPAIAAYRLRDPVTATVNGGPSYPGTPGTMYTTNAAYYTASVDLGMGMVKYSIKPNTAVTIPRVVATLLQNAGYSVTIA